MIRMLSTFDILKQGLAACRTDDEAREFWNAHFNEIDALEPHEQQHLIPLRDRFGKGKS